MIVIGVAKQIYGSCPEGWSLSRRRQGCGTQCQINCSLCSVSGSEAGSRTVLHGGALPMEPRSLEEGGLLPPPSTSHSSAGEERRPGHPNACHQKETVDSLMYVSEDILLTDVAVYFIVC